MALGKTNIPVRVYAEEDIRLPRRLQKDLEDKIAGYTQTIMQGQLTIERYKELTGKVAGLREALQIAEEIVRELSQG